MNEKYLGHMPSKKIDYRKIDKGIRGLIRELNKLGFETYASCEGHLMTIDQNGTVLSVDHDGMASFSLVVDSLDSIRIDTADGVQTITIQAKDRRADK